MKLNIEAGRRSLQIILWGWEDRDHWGFGTGRWPTGKTLEGCAANGWPNFGFHALVLGVIEFRYWPQKYPPNVRA